MSPLSLALKPRRPALLRGQAQTLDLLIALQAPDIPASHEQRRMPLHLAIVIDRSGSMSGRPLEEAKRCAAMLINRLGATDRVAIVDYADDAVVRADTQSAANSAALLTAINAIHTAGSTNLHLGWLTGAERIAPEVDKGSMSRVILLSDGMANRGLLEPDKIYEQCRDLAHAGVTTSTYGLGDHFDERLMPGMARAGLGNAYYGQSADDLMDPFQEEIAYLSNICARKVRIHYELAPHVSAEILNVSRTADDGSILLPDVAWQSEGWVMLRLTVGRDATLEPAPDALVTLLTARATYETLDGQPAEATLPTLRLPLLEPDAWSSVAQDATVIARAAQLELARIEQQAYRAARSRDWVEVERLLDVAERETMGSDWAQRTIRDMRALLAQKDEEKLRKEMAYSAVRKMAPTSLRSSGIYGESRGPSPMYVREKSSQGRALDPLQPGSDGK